MWGRPLPSAWPSLVRDPAFDLGFVVEYCKFLKEDLSIRTSGSKVNSLLVRRSSAAAAITNFELTLAQRLSGVSTLFRSGPPSNIPSTRLWPFSGEAPSQRICEEWILRNAGTTIFVKHHA
jgi:hypothetical protein